MGVFFDSILGNGKNYQSQVNKFYPCGLLHDIYIKKSYPFMVHPLLPVPRLYRNLGVIPGLRAVYGFMTSDWRPRTTILTM